MRLVEARGWGATSFGLGVQMEQADHLDTQSQSRSGNMNNWIVMQKSTIGNGNLMSAFELDADDVKVDFQESTVKRLRKRELTHSAW